MATEDTYWEISNRSVNPPGGWNYDQRLLDDAVVTVTGGTYSELVKNVLQMRRANSIADGAVHKDLAKQLCPRLPEGYCRELPTDPTKRAAVNKATPPKAVGCNTCGSRKTK